MNADDIKKLADIIATHKPGDIHRELRVLALTRNRHTEQQMKKRQLFTTALAFLQSHETLPDHWLESFACFEQLTEWFNSATQIENHTQLSALSWYIQMEKYIPYNANTRDLITLAKSFFGEPNKFIGYLFFLLEKNIAPRVIISSSRLHQYFAYHVADIVILQDTYQVLASLSERANHFVERLSEIACDMRGFVNLQTEDAEYRSYNLTGHLFSHRFSIINNRHNNEIFIVPDNAIANACDLFFKLFGWEFLKLLNINMHYDRDTHTDRTVFNSLLDDQELRRVLLHEFVQQVLIGAFSYSFIRAFFLAISDLNPQFIRDIIVEEPFYLHVISYKNLHFLFLYPENELVNNAITQLYTHEQYKTIAHFYHLTLLAKNSLLTETLQNKIINMLFEMMLPYGDHLPIEIENSLRNIQFNPGLMSLCQNKLNQYLQILHDAISQFNNHTMSYEELEMTWGGQNTYVILISSLHSQLPDVEKYPHTIYQLRTQVLQSHFEYCQRFEETFCLQSLMNTFAPLDVDLQHRCLQEALIDNSVEKRLIEAILDHVNDHFQLMPFLEKSFGYHNSVLLHAYSSANTNLRFAIQERIEIDETKKSNIISFAIDTDKLNKLARIITTIQLSTNIVEHTIEKLLTHTVAQQLNALPEDATEVFHTLLNRLQRIKISKKCLSKMLSFFIDMDATDLIVALCSLSTPNQLLPASFNAAMNQANAASKWLYVAMFCGLTDHHGLNEMLINRLDIKKYLDLIKTAQDFNSVVAMPLNNNLENILHIAANHCTCRQFKNHFNQIRLHLSHEQIRQLLISMDAHANSVSYRNNNNPSQHAINQYIVQLKDHYQASNRMVNTGLFSRRRGRGVDNNSQIPWRPMSDAEINGDNDFTSDDSDSDAALTRARAPQR